jgi:hypothetical protein
LGFALGGGKSVKVFGMVIAANQAWWHVPLLSAAAALVGVLLAQGVVLWIYRQNERRRGDPELLRQCAAFNVALGKVKRALSENAVPSDLGELEEAFDSLNIIAPDGILEIVDRIWGDIGAVLMFGDELADDREQLVSGIFRRQMDFTQAVRSHFKQPPRIHRAVPLITSEYR